MERTPTTALAARFSAAAGTYAQAARIQQTVAGQVAHRVAALRPAPRQVLEIGCGTGLLTGLLHEALPDAAIHALDLSAGMLAEARRRLGHAPNLIWHQADARTFLAPAPLHLIISSSTLHWIQPLRPLFHKFQHALTPGGHLVFGLMLDGTLAELHAARRRIAPDNPARATLPSLADVLAALQAAQFHVLQQEQESLTATYPSAMELLRAIHDQGTTSGELSRGNHPLSRHDLQRLLADYTCHYGDGAGGVEATYDVLYVTARREAGP
jgi:malonyl-CoA O-methyltransferase